jgi:phage terminase large subunit
MLNFQCTDVFYENYKSTEKLIINQGGTSSSKTYSICQLLFLKAINEPNIVISITGESLPNLKKGALRDSRTITSITTGLSDFILFWNKTDNVITFKNASLIEFITNLDEQSAKNGKRDYLFVNEANGIDFPVFFQLAIRTRKQIYIDYNPSAPFWVHDKFIGTNENSNDLSASVKLIISDHRHNNFLSAEDHRKIEGIKDKELWRVYARGLTGNLEGLIFSDWKMIPDSMFPNEGRFVGGLDFGYTNDPTAGVKRVKVGNNIYFKELCYESGLAPKQIKLIFESEGFTTNNIIYCEHDPDMINQLRRLGLQAYQAKKGQGSVNAGILHLKQFNVYYTESSKNLHNERIKYMWAKDATTGKPINTPIDKYNHLMDSCRYSTFSELNAQTV